MRYESTIVKKPWGYEYLAYENKDVALWFLSSIKDYFCLALNLGFVLFII